MKLPATITVKMYFIYWTLKLSQIKGIIKYTYTFTLNNKTKPRF